MVGVKQDLQKEGLGSSVFSDELSGTACLGV